MCFFSDETFLVTDYCPRALLTVNSGDIVPQLPTKEMQAIGKHLIIMTLLENHEGKTIEMVRKKKELQGASWVFQGFHAPFKGVRQVSFALPGRFVAAPGTGLSGTLYGRSERF